MTILLNILIALLCGMLARFISDAAGMDSRISLLVAVLVTIIVFLANPASHL